MSDFHDVITAGMERLWKEDTEIQVHWIEVICKEIRSIDPDVVLNAKGFFVPNDEYMVTVFGPRIRDPEFDVYQNDNHCVWTQNLIVPIKNVAGTIVGLAGFNPYRYMDSKEDSSLAKNYYSYSTKRVFNKGKYLFCLDGTYQKALKDGYIVITDGFFDTLSLAYAGYNAAALLGSYVSPEVVMQLRFIDKVILAVDNDIAGLQLYQRLSQGLHNVYLFKQNKGKDVDDVLKSEFRLQYLRELDRFITGDACVRFARAF